MNCDHVERLITEGGALPDDAAAHLAGCTGCQAFKADVALLLETAALPEPSAQERAALATLSATTLAAWRHQERKRGAVRQWLGYAMAAGLGAVVASAVLLKVRPVEVVQAPLQVVMVADESGYDDGDDLHLSDDEVSFELTWPSSAEGENL